MPSYEFIPLIKNEIQATDYLLPRAGLLLTNKEVRDEAKSTWNNTLTIHVCDLHQANFAWSLRVVPQSLLPRIGTLRAEIHATAISHGSVGLEEWLSFAPSLQLDVLHIMIRLSIGTGGYHAQLPDSVANSYERLFSTYIWSGSSCRYVIDAIEESDVKQLKIELCNAPAQILADLSDATRCIEWLGTDLPTRHRLQSASNFKVLPINVDQTIVVTKA